MCQGLAAFLTIVEFAAWAAESLSHVPILMAVDRGSRLSGGSISYNEDDCRAMRVVKERLGAGGQTGT